MTGNQVIRWGIIGAGEVAEVKSGPAFQKAENSTLLAVMRRDRERAMDFASRHRVPRWYDDADLLLADPEIDAVYVATPPDSHMKYAVKALQAGKSVYLEKPMALNVEDSEAIRSIEKKSPGNLVVAHYRRALPAFIKVSELLEDRAIGEVRLARITILQPTNSALIARSEVNWRLEPSISGGGLFHDLAPHQLDLMLHWFGKPVDGGGIAANRSGASRADDLVTGQFTCSTGVVVHGLWCFCVSAGQAADRCEIFGTEGVVSFSFFGNEVSWRNAHGDFSQSFELPEHVQLPMIQRAVHYFLGQDKNPCPVDDAIEGIRLMAALTGKGD